MSTAAHRSASSRHLQLAPATDGLDPAGPEGSPVWSMMRPPLLRVCAGEALLLTDDDVNLVDLVNQASAISPWLLDDDADPDQYRLAEVLLDHLCHKYGTQRRGKGDRLKNLESAYRRHLLPFLIELDASLPADQRGVASKRLRHLEKLPAILAGDAPLPAATVAGDRLNRRGIACIFLDLRDASNVVSGGARALDVALRDGAIELHADVQTGREIVRTADLRTAGLLLERAVQLKHGSSSRWYRWVCCTDR
jgi:hypothetical protein